MYLNPNLYHVTYDSNVFESVQLVQGYLAGGSLSIEVKDGIEQADTIIELLNQNDKLIGTIRAIVNIEALNNEP